MLSTRAKNQQTATALVRGHQAPAGSCARPLDHTYTRGLHTCLSANVHGKVTPAWSLAARWSSTGQEVAPGAESRASQRGLPRDREGQRRAQGRGTVCQGVDWEAWRLGCCLWGSDGMAGAEGPTPPLERTRSEVETEFHIGVSEPPRRQQRERRGREQRARPVGKDSAALQTNCLQDSAGPGGGAVATGGVSGGASLSARPQPGSIIWCPGEISPQHGALGGESWVNERQWAV